MCRTAGAREEMNAVVPPESAAPLSVPPPFSRFLGTTDAHRQEAPRTLATYLHTHTHTDTFAAFSVRKAFIEAPCFHAELRSKQMYH